MLSWPRVVKRIDSGRVRSHRESFLFFFYFPPSSITHKMATDREERERERKWWWEKLVERREYSIDISKKKKKTQNPISEKWNSLKNRRRAGAFSLAVGFRQQLSQFLPRRSFTCGTTPGRILSPYYIDCGREAGCRPRPSHRTLIEKLLAKGERAER